MPTDAEYEAAMRREAERKRKKAGKQPKPTKPKLRDKIKRRMDRLDEITRNGTTPDRRYS